MRSPVKVTDQEVVPVIVARPLNDGEDSPKETKTLTVAPASIVPVIVGAVLVGDDIKSIPTVGGNVSITIV